jgi:hypothetical protein
MLQFDLQTYHDIFSDIIDKNRLNDLGPGQKNSNIADSIQSLNLEKAFEPDTIRDYSSAQACLSAIWLHHDFLDQSHQISQSIPTSSGSFWHGIMHRREGDYWNGKYWFRQVGNHPVFPDLIAGTEQLLNTSDITEIRNLVQETSWDPFLFVDLVERYIGTDSEIELILKQVQQLEWRLLFDYCFRKAIGMGDVDKKY